MDCNQLYKCKPGTLLKLNKEFLFYIRDKDGVFQSSMATHFNKETIILLLGFKKDYYSIYLELLIGNKVHCTFPSILHDNVDMIDIK